MCSQAGDDGVDVLDGERDVADTRGVGRRASTGASPCSSSPSSTKNAVAAARSSTTMPTCSMRWIVMSSTVPGYCRSVPVAVVNALLVVVVVLGSFAMWTVVPLGWIQLTAGLLSGQGARFVMVIFGCPLAMCAAFVLVSRIEAHRLTLLGYDQPEPDKDRGDQPIWRSPLLETSLVAGAGLAIVALALWWFLGADNHSPSGPLQPL